MTSDGATASGSRGAGSIGPLVLALLAGAAAALAFPPFGFLPGLAGFGLLLRLLDDQRGRGDGRFFLLGWLAGLSYFLISTWWVGEAFLVDVSAHGWQAPFAVLFLGGGLALIWGGAAVAYRRAAPAGALRLVAFALCFAVAEWLRGHIFTGFPWDIPGEAWRAGSPPSQGAAVIGAYGMTFLTLLIGGAAGLVRTRAPRGDKAALLCAALCLGLLYAGGAWRLAGAAPPARSGVLVRVVQANVPQTEKWTPEALRGIILNYAALTALPAKRTPDAVIWPEGAIPLTVEDLLAPGSWSEDVVVNALKPGQILLFGSTRAEGTGGGVRYYNSLLAMRRGAAGAEGLGVYDKHHLVPFGEYMPFDAVAGRLGIKALVHVGDGFTPGPRPEPLALPVLGRVQPLICYESLFPSMGGRTGGRAQWIVNVSNDAWFGDTSGPWQHLNLAGYRAIEEGLPMIRATPTGVSAVVDGYGRVVSRLGVGRRGVIDAVLPPPLPPTLYERWRDAPFGIVCLAGALIVAGRRRSEGRALERRSSAR